MAIVERFNCIQTRLVTGSCSLEFQLTVSSATIATHLMKFDPKFSALLRIPVVINTNKPPPKPIKEIQSFSSTKRKRTQKGQYRYMDIQYINIAAIEYLPTFSEGQMLEIVTLS